MLSCLKELPFEPHFYQVETANNIITKMNCRALIADEVGLGKTIEAGLVIKELIDLGQAKKILILVPASLGHQWAAELYTKFGLNFFVCRKGDWAWYHDRVIASLEKAKMEQHRNIIMEQEYDLVIIDEAHKLKNRKTANWKFVSELKTKGLLLLTATPLQNKVEEVYNLVSLLRPDKFNDYNSFLKHYELNPKSMINDLRDKLKDVMIRNLTSEVGVKKSNRNIQLIPVEMLPEEKIVYNYLKQIKGSFLPLILTKEFCSSMPALYYTAEYKGFDWLIPMLVQIKTCQKLKELEKIVSKHPGKILIFTEYLQTQYYIAKNLTDQGVKVLIFNGQFRTGQKEYIKHLFQNQDFKVLICTDSGSQGLNLHYCSVIVNYDLPWNPMKVEQRIGRIDRIGQKSEELYIYNFVLKDTLEEKIFHVLSKKISLFKACIGNLDNILADDDDSIIEMLDKF